MERLTKRRLQLDTVEAYAAYVYMGYVPVCAQYVIAIVQENM